MSIFAPGDPIVHKNTFTIDDATKVFKEVAEKIEQQEVPAEVAQILIQVAKVVVDVIKVASA